MSFARSLLALSLLVSSSLGAQAAAKPAPASDPRVVRADLARIDGSAGAKVWMLMISDFQCPYCKDFHDKTARAIHREFVATGKLRFAYLHFPLVNTHPNALPAAEASMCGGAQDKFWPFHDRLFADVANWAQLPDPVPQFVAMARNLKLDMTAFQKCLADDVMLPMIQNDTQRGSQAGARSTPTFIIGTQVVPGNAPLEVLRGIINGQLSKAP